MLFVPKWLYNSPQDTHDDEQPPESPTAVLSAKLEHFRENGERPPSSRIDPFLEQQPNQPRSLTDFWKYGVLIASKATDVASDLVRHHLFGARKKSWGVEMTIISALMRNIGQNTALASLPTLRAVMAISGLAPVPSDAIVTPVTFRARKRNLRGFLAEHDAKEDGNRVLSAEWIVGKRLWLRLQNEWGRAKADGKGRRPRHRKERVILFLHGGAYYMFSTATHRLLTIPLSKYTDARVFALDYRLAPETRFPGQLHDAVLAYLRLIEDLHIPPENIVVCGDSAGGGLSMSLLLYLRDNNYPLPSAAILMSPWVDLTMSCDSWDSNARIDWVPVPIDGDHLNPILCYLGPEGMAKHLTHPYASPLFGSMKGLPPLLIQSGDAEVLRDEAMLLAHKATLAGVTVRHEIYEDQVHVFQMFFFLEVAQKALTSCRDFINGIIARAPKEMGKEVEAFLEREIAGDGARVVRGDGTVEDDVNPNDLSKLSTPGGHKRDGSPSAESSSSSDIEPSWEKASPLPPTPEKSTQDPHIRDGTSVASNDGDAEEQESHISFKPRRRSPKTSDASFSPSPSPTITLLQPKPKSKASNIKADTDADTQTHNSSLANVNAHSEHPPKLHVLTNTTNNNGSPRGLSRRQTYMQLSHANSPTSPPSAMPVSSSVPSVRRRARATSHPDVFQLCQSWAELGPANEAVHIEASSQQKRGT